MWRPSLFQREPRVLRVVREATSALPPERPPTASEAAKIAPLIPHYAQGTIPLDAAGADNVRRWFEHTEKAFRKRRSDWGGHHLEA